MLHATTTAADKRARLRARLATGEILALPGAFNPLSAMLIERRGFEATYLSGAVLAADLGLPDVGLTSVSEVALRAGQVARVTNLPLLVDADTGFGEAMNVARSVQLLEDAGVAGLHLEDQVNPKRCGHLDGKQVVDRETAVRRVRAAVEARRDPNLLIIARTDARATDSLDEAMTRAKSYVEAGADAIFAEALLDESEFSAMRAAIDVPLLANATEFGKGELLDIASLAALGVNMVIFPVSLLRLAMGACDRGLAALSSEGSVASVLGAMQTRGELYDLLDYSSYRVFDDHVFNFEVPS
ncbi:MAG TPA: methylisocitrate lyase [Acidimicrobiales bacterium]|nr:methylisocitrate lyase [Acidimicrobiales bacterium]